MRTRPPASLPLFRSDLQARVLAILFLGDGRAHSVADLAERTGATRSSLHRELHRLLDAGILERVSVGRTQLYQAADSPVREPLTELLSRTLAVDQLLADRLSALEGVHAAAIYGSWAAGHVGPSSDIDVLVVGTVAYDDLISALRPVERQAGREISVKLFRPAEYRERLRARSGFLRTVLSRPIRELVGDLDDVGEDVP